MRQDKEHPPGTSLAVTKVKESKLTAELHTTTRGAAAPLRSSHFVDELPSIALCASSEHPGTVTSHAGPVGLLPPGLDAVQLDRSRVFPARASCSSAICRCVPWRCAVDEKRTTLKLPEPPRARPASQLLPHKAVRPAQQCIAGTCTSQPLGSTGACLQGNARTCSACPTATLALPQDIVMQAQQPGDAPHHR